MHNVRSSGFRGLGLFHQSASMNVRRSGFHSTPESQAAETTGLGHWLFLQKRAESCRPRHIKCQVLEEPDKEAGFVLTAAWGSLG